MERLRQIFLVPAAIALLALFCVGPVLAQEVTGSITGTVTDASGGVIAGAAVTATDVNRGTTWSATSNDDGIYSILRIPVGDYTLKAEAKGFQTDVLPPIHARPGPSCAAEHRHEGRSRQSNDGSHR
jgi:hypothetical protein